MRFTGPHLTGGGTGGGPGGVKGGPRCLICSSAIVGSFLKSRRKSLSLLSRSRSLSATSGSSGVPTVFFAAIPFPCKTRGGSSRFGIYRCQCLTTSGRGSPRGSSPVVIRSRVAAFARVCGTRAVTFIKLEARRARQPLSIVMRGFPGIGNDLAATTCFLWCPQPCPLQNSVGW